MGYRSRRTLAWFAGRPVCVSARCGRERVLYGVYCRGHANAIFFGPADQQPSPGVESPRYWPTEAEVLRKFPHLTPETINPDVLGQRVG